ncbi:MAG: hypothetical protein R3B99_29180 [Polyangiales bacterium]
MPTDLIDQHHRGLGVVVEDEVVGPRLARRAHLREPTNVEDVASGEVLSIRGVVDEVDLDLDEAVLLDAEAVVGASGDRELVRPVLRREGDAVGGDTAAYRRAELLPTLAVHDLERGAGRDAFAEHAKARGGNPGRAGHVVGDAASVLEPEAREAIVVAPAVGELGLRGHGEQRGKQPPEPYEPSCHRSLLR